MDYQQELKTALEAVAQASQLCARVQEKLITADTLAKKDKSPVTVADFGAQALILHTLTNIFPEDACVAEEDADALETKENQALCQQVETIVQEFTPELTKDAILAAIRRGAGKGGSNGRFWTLDPIDGTKGFLRNEQYAVALALIENGEVVLGVLGCPNLPVCGEDEAGEKGCLFYAVRGSGTQMLPMKLGAIAVPVRVASINNITEACLCESVESGHTKHDASADIAEKLGITRPPVRMDSQCKYAALARGQASIYLRLPTRAGYVERIWDHAAGSIVVTEAGGVVTDISGAALDFSQGRGLEKNRGVVASIPAFLPQIIQAIQNHF